MRTLVVGGTGTVGRYLVTELLDRGHEVAVLSRRGGSPDPRATGYAGDLTTGTGLEQALDGVDCVIDVATVRTTKRDDAVRYFTTTTETLGRLGAVAGVRHHVVLGIVGSDRVPLGYYAGKVAQEGAALAGPVPATVLRATQFHEFAGQTLDQFSLGPVGLVPGIRVQPIAASEVAVALADVAAKSAVGRAPDIGGPAVEWLPRLARAVARRKLVVTLPVPGSLGRAIRRGALLVGPGGQQRGPTFARWLAGQR